MLCPPGPAKRMVALVTSKPVIRTMDESDPGVMGAAFAAIGGDKPPALFQRYLAEQEEGRRLAFVAEWRGESRRLRDAPVDFGLQPVR